MCLSIFLSICPFICPSHFFLVSLHFQTNCSGIDLRLGEHNSLWHSPDLINFWSYFAEFLPFPGLIKQFACICGQTALGIDLKLGGYIRFGTLKAWLTFAHAPMNTCYYMASDWLSNFHAFADKPLLVLSSNLEDELVMGLPAWLIFGHIPLNSRCLLASD